MELNKRSMLSEIGEENRVYIVCASIGGDLESSSLVEVGGADALAHPVVVE